MMNYLKSVSLVKRIASSIIKKGGIPLFFVSLLSFPMEIFAIDIDPRVIEQVAGDPQWIRLLHASKSLFGSWQSQVQGRQFFLDEQGFQSPQRELEATLRYFLNEQKQVADKNDDPLCLFPARKAFLKHKLNLKEADFRQVQCPLLNRYLETLQPEKVSFVFSSYYTNNPGSAFGHTFFRIHKKRPPERAGSELLDHGIGYAASATTDNPFLFAMLGIFGGFPGEFTNLPYYYKVREYNDFESRDIWDYELNLSTQEVEMLTLHLWELGNTHFRYFFFTQNCAYQMLTVLDAAAPRLNLAAEVKPWVIPVDALKIVTESPELVRSVKMRPSLSKQFLHRYQVMTEKEKAEFLQIRKKLDSKEYQKLNYSLENPESLVNLLDTSLDYLDVSNPKLLFEKESAAYQFKQDLLLHRSQISLVSSQKEILVDMEEASHEGHGANRLGVMAFESEKGDVRGSVFEFRFSLHDLLDDDRAYLKYSQLNFGKFRFVHADSKDLRLLSADIVDIATFNPIKEVDSKTSWRMKVALQSSKNIHWDILLPNISGGLGYSILVRNHLLYSLLEGENLEQSILGKWTLGMLLKPSTKVNLLFETSPGYDFTREQSVWSYSLAARYLTTKNFNLNLEVYSNSFFDRAFAGVYYFY